MQIKVECIGGPADGEVYTVNEFQDYINVIIPPTFHVFEPPDSLDNVEPLPIHTYSINHSTRECFYRGRS
jgi:hypothetical protein